MTWFRFDAHCDVFIVRIAEQVEPDAERNIVHLHRIRGLLRDGISREMTIGELLDRTQEELKR